VGAGIELKLELLVPELLPLELPLLLDPEGLGFGGCFGAIQSYANDIELVSFGK
jgi:hypothetical protein